MAGPRKISKTGKNYDTTSRADKSLNNSANDVSEERHETRVRKINNASQQLTDAYIVTNSEYTAHDEINSATVY